MASFSAVYDYTFISRRAVRSSQGATMFASDDDDDKIYVLQRPDVRSVDMTHTAISLTQS